MDEHEPYCETTEIQAAGQEARTPVEGPFAECVLCRAPTEYPETVKGRAAVSGVRVAGGGAHGLLRLTA
ncbi:UNVERIFIED_CONTAM: hypothetical protein RKD43_005457 [Streptomyces graminofaciens]